MRKSVTNAETSIPVARNAPVHHRHDLADVMALSCSLVPGLKWFAIDNMLSGSTNEGDIDLSKPLKSEV